jgi:tRNA(Ile)-lysidine synthase
VHWLVQSVLKCVRDHDLLPAGDRVGVAVSGGADSVGLLRILLDLRDELGVVLSSVHLNHQLRGAEADGDEQFVRVLAEKHGLPLFSVSREIRNYASERKLSLEAAAREARYEFFTKLITEGEINKVATAHTLDDQAETVLLKLARGAGTRGLAGIYPKIGIDSSQSGIPAAIVRPLLATQRKDIERYLHQLKQNWREDASNRDLCHARNRVRHEIVPRLEELVNSGARENLAQAAEIARAEEEYWSQYASALLAELWSKNDTGGALNRQLMQQQPLAVRRRLVRAAGESLGLNLEFRQVEAVLSLREQGSRAALTAQWRAVLRNNDILFERENQELDQEKEEDYEYCLVVPAKVAVKQAHVLIEIGIQSSTESPRDSANMLSMDFAERELTIRNWRPGDRFWPAHTSAPKKIKELLQDRHITGEEKKRWPVVASGDVVVWVRGLGVHREYQARNGAGVLIRDLPFSASK